jgi:hypothetical protein
MTIRDFSPGRDEGLLLGLRRAVWGEDHLHNDADFFSWLFQRNPDGAGGGVLIENEDKALGFAGLATRKLICQNQQISIAMGMDYMIHPEHRNGFAASRLVNSWIKSVSGGDYAFALCFPNNNSYKILTGKKLGWQPVCELAMLVRPLGTVSKAPGKLSKLPGWILAPAFRAVSLLCALRAKVSSRKPPGRMCEIDHFDERFDVLWRAAGIRMGTVRNAAHLNWRYTEHPLYAYRVFAWVDGDRVLGYVVVTRREIFDIPAVLVVDALSDPAVPGVIEALVDAVASDAQRDGARMLGTQAIHGSQLADAFQRAGLIAVPKRIAPKTFTLTAHGLGRPLPPLDVASWHLTWGDMDVI